MYNLLKRFDFLMSGRRKIPFTHHPASTAREREQLYVWLRQEEGRYDSVVVWILVQKRLAEDVNQQETH